MSAASGPLALDLPFDQVIVRAGDRVMGYTIEAFLQLPLPERIRFVLEQSLEFRRGGQAVDRALALRSLREAMAQRFLSRR